MKNNIPTVVFSPKAFAASVFRGGDDCESSRLVCKCGTGGYRSAAFKRSRCPCCHKGTMKSCNDGLTARK